jgi:hypothetical protein
MNQRAIENIEQAISQYPDMLEYPWSDIYKKTGFNTLVTLSDILGGTSVYIPVDVQ